MDTWRFWRRGLFAGVAAAAGGLAEGGPNPKRALAQGAAAPSAASRKGLECIVLGTKGGPRVGPGRSNPGYVFLVDGVPYLVDCGPRVTGQLVMAGVPLQSIHKIFITHHHNDHNIELRFNRSSQRLPAPIAARRQMPLPASASPASCAAAR